MDNDKANQDSTLVSALRILARDIDSEDGVANALIAEAADRIEDLAAEQDKYMSDARRLREVVGELRGLLLEVLQHDEVLEGFNADNLEPEFRQRIRDGLSWKIE
jgi:hypothetical protein